MSLDKPKVNREPKMSLNKLGEYLQADTVRRNAIIRDQVKERTFMKNIYDEALVYIRRYFTEGFNEQILNDGITVLELTPPDSEYHARNLGLCIQLLEATLLVEIPDILYECSITNYQTPKGAKLEFEEVKVSSSPSFLIHRTHRDKTQIGGIKISTGKTYPLESKSQASIAAIMKHHLETFEVLDDDFSIKSNLCFSIDLFADNSVSSPGGIKRKLDEAKYACQEIKWRWSSFIED